eukprot:XP_015154778.1 acyl-CoA-binding domain-containing protein 4 isoform X5 [Gallus gallus]
MAEPGCGAQFQAAVRVIQGLPRSGSYRPSYEEMLRFYSYYKQATAGRCQEPRPGFWDPIGRYKWDAWHSLGRMSKEEAMAAYVAEMKKVAQKIIDTVRPDETTQEMFRYFEPLYEVIRDMPRPPDAFFRRAGDEQEQPAERGQEERASGPALECPEDALPGEQQDGQQAPGWSPRCGQHPAETPRRRQWRRGWAGPPSQRRAVGFRSRAGFCCRHAPGQPGHQRLRGGGVLRYHGADGA